MRTRQSPQRTRHVNPNPSDRLGRRRPALTHVRSGRRLCSLSTRARRLRLRPRELIACCCRPRTSDGPPPTLSTSFPPASLTPTIPRRSCTRPLRKASEALPGPEAILALFLPPSQFPHAVLAAPPACGAPCRRCRLCRLTTGRPSKLRVPALQVAPRVPWDPRRCRPPLCGQVPGRGHRAVTTDRCHRPRPSTRTRRTRTESEARRPLEPSELPRPKAATRMCNPPPDCPLEADNPPSRRLHPRSRHGLTTSDRRLWIRLALPGLVPTPA